MSTEGEKVVKKMENLVNVVCERPQMTCKLQEKNARFAPSVHTSLFLPKEDKLSHSMELLEHNTAISIQTIVIFLQV